MTSPTVPQVDMHFLDVGQGGCSVLTFFNEEGQREAIVVDCGPQSAAAVIERLLQHREVERLRCVFVTHNHRDHVGGLLPLLRHWAHKKKLGHVYLVPDGAKFSGTLGEGLEELGRKTTWDLGRHLRLLSDGVALTIAKGLSLGVTLRAIAPGRSAVKHVRARSRGRGLLAWFKSASPLSRNWDPNDLSGVLQFRYGKVKVLLPGDITLPSWLTFIAGRRRSKKPLRFEAVVAPHHGGRLARSAADAAARRFFSELIQAKNYIFSYASKNAHRHLRQSMIRGALAAGDDSTVLCTEVHPCLREYFADRDHPYLFPLTAYSYANTPEARRKTDAEGRPRHVGCAGTVTLSVRTDCCHWGNAEEERLEELEPICAFETLEDYDKKVRDAFGPLLESRDAVRCFEDCARCHLRHGPSDLTATG